MEEKLGEVQKQTLKANEHNYVLAFFLQFLHFIPVSSRGRLPGMCKKCYCLQVIGDFLVCYNSQ